jgi:hypothetical protein
VTTQYKIAVVAAVVLAIIVATILILEENVHYRDRSVTSQEKAAERNDAREPQQATSAIKNLTLNTPSTKTDSTSSSAASPDSGVLRWPASEYEAVFGLGEPLSPLQKVHADFVDEPRDASWASAMESGISQALVRSDATAEISVAYVECRSTICEVAGFVPDRMQNPELDPYSLFPDDLGAGWWQGTIDMGIGTHTYDDEGITRFIVIIAEPDAFLTASERY